MLYNTDWDRKAAEEIPCLDVPTLKALIYCLRHKELWPKSFQWNYAQCHSCAMGLAYLLWETILPIPVRGNYILMGNEIGLDEKASHNVFMGWDKDTGLTWTGALPDMFYLYGITPEKVADQLEKYL